MDFKLEFVLIPVSDVDRAKEFYVDKCGFNLDVDTSPAENLRVVRMTPPGSACSVTIGNGIIKATPGSVEGLHLVVTDIVAARAQLAERGIEIGEVFHFEAGKQAPGPDPARSDFNSFSSRRQTTSGTCGSTLAKRYEAGKNCAALRCRTPADAWTPSAPSRGLATNQIRPPVLQSQLD
jgi:catechol 2,3-dioxygenase-like lactoylglutathione lyase family enzyme